MPPLPKNSCLLCRHDGLLSTRGQHKLGSSACPYSSNIADIERILSYLRHCSDATGAADAIAVFLGNLQSQAQPSSQSSGESASRPIPIIHSTSTGARSVVQDILSLKIYDPPDTDTDTSSKMLSRLHFEDWEKHLVPNEFNLHSILKFRRTKEDFSYDKSVEHTAISSFVSRLADTANDSKWRKAALDLCANLRSQMLGEEVKLFWTKNEMEMIDIQNELLKKKVEQTALTYLTTFTMPQIAGEKKRDPQEESSRSAKSEAVHQYSKTEATKPLLEIVKTYSSKTQDSHNLAHSFILELSGSSAIQYEFSNAQWQQLVADIPEIGKTKFCEEIEPILGPLFVSSDPAEKEIPKLEARTKWEAMRNVHAPSSIDFNWKKVIWWIEVVTGKFLDAFEAEVNPLTNNCPEGEFLNCYVLPILKGVLDIDGVCRNTVGEVSIRSSLRRKNQDKYILEEKVERGHMADMLTTYNQHELMCTLAAGGPKKHDLTKHAKDLYTLHRNLKDMLDELREHHRLQGRDPSHLYTLGVQTYMNTFNVYMLEKREVYRLHLIKNVNLPLQFDCYGFLKEAICAAWNVRGMVKHLVEDLKKAKDPTWTSFGRPEIHEKLLTPDTPSKTRKVRRG